MFTLLSMLETSEVIGYKRIHWFSGPCCYSTTTRYRTYLLSLILYHHNTTNGLLFLIIYVFPLLWMSSTNTDTCQLMVMCTTEYYSYSGQNRIFLSKLLSSLIIITILNTQTYCFKYKSVMNCHSNNKEWNIKKHTLDYN